MGGNRLESEPEQLAEVTALPPYDSSSAVFRQAVYTCPERVRILLPVDRVGDANVVVATLAPGTRLVVSGPSERPWKALLTCGEASQFAVTRAPAAPPEAA